jgi:hypothetical protein
MLLLTLLPLLTLLLMLVITHQVACYFVDACYCNHAAWLDVCHNHIHAQHL